MRLGDRLRQLDRLQKSTPFKGAASVLVVAVTIGILGWIVLDRAAEARQETAEQRSAQTERGADAGAAAGGQAERDAQTAAQRAIDTMLSARDDPTGAAVGVALVGGVALAVVWLGLGLTYLGLALAAGAIVYPLTLAGAPTDLILLVGGVLTLTGAFTALMQGLREVFSGPHPVFAVARNVLAEAVRLKLSIVFIVMLVFGLSALPSLLDEGEELRYRVQSFLQYGTGGAFWIIALLTVLFSVATVTFEQRDKLIWQTMTKPVASWQYLFGKWLGVVGLSGVLLGVSASGVFLMVDYLRNQEAMEEIAPYVSGNENMPITEDRLLLESQVLTARRSREPDPPISKNDESFLQGVEEFIETEKKQDPRFENIEENDQLYRDVVDDLYKSWLQYARGVEPRRMRRFTFSGLGPARSVDRPLTLSYKIEVPGALPSHFYQLAFEINGERSYRFMKEQVAVDTTHTLTIPNDAISEDGTLVVNVANAGVVGSRQWRTIQFTPDGLELSYSVGGFHANYLRAVLVLWMKLALLSMIAICLSTILSFPVATLAGLTIFLAAEGSGYLATAMEVYGQPDPRGNLEPVRAVINVIANTVIALFGIYADLKPTTRLVEGRVLTWTNVGLGLGVLGVMTGALYAIGVAMFRKRELAIYSGN